MKNLKDINSRDSRFQHAIKLLIHFFSNSRKLSGDFKNISEGSEIDKIYSWRPFRATLFMARRFSGIEKKFLAYGARRDPNSGE